MAAPKFASVADYIAALDPVKAKTLGGVVDLILEEFPGLEAGIAWNVPVIRRGKSYVAGIDAHKKHLTFSAWSPEIIEAFKPRLEGYVVFKNCFQIPVEWEIDRGLILDLVRARLAELDRES